MLKRILLLISFLFFSFPTHAENWVPIHTTPNGDKPVTMFLDVDSIRKYDDSIVVWIKFTDESGFYQYAKEQFFLSPPSFKPLVFIYKSGKGNLDDVRLLKEPVQPLHPESHLSKVYSYVRKHS